MKGKLRKIGLGLSGLMCAGMLFTCVLPAKAAPCQHITYMYLGWSDEYVDGFDHHGHYIRRDELGCCATCGEIFTFQSTIVRKEDHKISTVWDEKNEWLIEKCEECGYTY